ncbi:HAMP domain-containing sensor histidine kinase [Flectobacillus longus]|uniref:HAMP domain-containing sensor histidine kinase n=1 Tax=Flectobacillus longus TaxID=2984207 RepID=UPI0024B76D0B|nr:ATP-binding protein [Flectobacillus longus]MDI9879263.1 ATP-binding protein [Flectobacillus longus]
MKTRTKMASIFFTSCLLTILLLGTAVYYSFNKYSHVDFDKRVQTRAIIASKYYLEKDTNKSEAYKMIREQFFEKLHKEKEMVIQITSTQALDYYSTKYHLPENFLKQIIMSGKATHRDGDLVYSGLRYSQGTKTSVVVVSAENYFTAHHLAYLRNVLLIAIGLGTLLTLYVSIYFSTHIFDPVKEITDKVRQISTDNIHLRLDEPTNNHEIGELASTFNQLLDRLETAFEIQKNFISNASHELGTPLTVIIGEADLALRKERTSEVYQEAIHNILTQAERLDHITKSLLFLAQSGYQGDKPNREIVRTDQLLWDVKETFDRLSPKNYIIVDLSEVPEDPKRLKIMGNRQLLLVAFSNIIGNACKYSHNKPVTIFIKATDLEVILVIKDQGIGIPDEEISQIFNPFFRASNTQLFEGYGIGLPLSRNVIKMHNGYLEVTSQVGVGTTFTVRFPHILANKAIGV